MSKNENEIVSQILEYLRYNHIFAWRNNNTPVYDPRNKKFRSMPKGSIKGVPDIIGILNTGEFLGIEVKTKTGKVSKYQEEFIERAKKDGGICFVARSLQDVIEKLNF